MQSNRIAKEAYYALFGKNVDVGLEYSGRYKEYNAKIVQKGSEITVFASKKWKEVSEEIQKGLIQELLVRLKGEKKETINMELYSNFIKSLPDYVEKTQTEPILENSFIRINEKYFGNMMEMPNLKLGRGINQLGKYEYASDTITISKILLEDLELLDYVMYHELLHKKLKFSTKNGRHTHHSRQFKMEERKYPNYETMEKRLERTVKRAKKLF